MRKKTAVIMTMVFVIMMILEPLPAETMQAADNITWELSGNEIVIRGSGAVSDSLGKEIWTALGEDVLSTVKSVRIEKGITSVDTMAFTDFPILNRFEVPETVDGMAITGRIKFKQFVADGNLFFSGFAGDDYLTSVEVKGTAYFRDYAFSGDSMLQKVVFGRACDIATGSFQGCKNLKTVEISEFRGVVEEEAFADCENLQSVYLCGSRQASLERKVFEGCTKLETLVLPENLKRIESMAVNDSPQLKRIELPESLSYIGAYNFSQSDIFWGGDLPETEEDFFEQQQGTMYVPQENDSWKEKKESYPAITWKEWNSKEMTINQIPLATPVPKPALPQIPVVESGDAVYCNFSDALLSEEAGGATKTETVKDEEGEECTSFLFQKKYQRAVFRLPANLNIEDYKSITFKADTAVQFVVDILNDDFNSWNMDQGFYTKPQPQYGGYYFSDIVYPFYEGSYCDRDKTTQTPGIEEETKKIGQGNHKVDKMSYLAIALTEEIPDEDTITRPLHYYVYSITLNPKENTHKKVVIQTKKLENAAIPPTPVETPVPEKRLFVPSETEMPSATEVPSAESTQAPDNKVLPTPSASPSKLEIQINKSQEVSLRKAARPLISLKKKGSGKLRYIQVTVKAASSRYFDLYMKKKGKKYVRIRLKKASLKKGKRVVKLAYSQKGFTLWFKVRTYDKIKGRKRYGAYSVEKKVHL